jgi:pilus assembly protein Flp/PilA
LAAHEEGKALSPGAFQAPLVNLGGAMRQLTKLLRCDRGANAIEYALVASLISIAAIGAYSHLGDKVDIMLNNVSNNLD